MAPYFTAATAVAILPKPVSTTTRLSGRVVCRVSTTSSPLPSSSFNSTTAKAGGASLARALPSATDSAWATVKPRASMARASRSRRGRSSSTKSRVLSSGVISGAFRSLLPQRQTQTKLRLVRIAAPAGFCGLGRRKAQPVSGNTGKPFDEPRTQKTPAPSGLRSGGPPRRRRARPYCRYALRAAPGGSPLRNATQTVLTSLNLVSCRSAELTCAGRLALCDLCLCLGRRLGAIDDPAGPADGNHGAAARRIFRLNQPARLFQQDLGDEEAEPHAFMFVQRALRPHIGLAQGMMAGPGGNVGLAQGLENLRGKAGPIIGYRNVQELLIPAGADRDRGIGEVGRILDDVAKPMQQFGRAPDLRNGAVLGHGKRDGDRHILAPVMGGDIIQEGAQRQARGGTHQRLFRIGQPSNDGTAAFRLLTQQAHIFHLAGIFRQRPLQFPRHHRDGAKRRAQLMRGGGRQRAQRRQAM